jgi:hypothetical protein|nr:MAG TPA: hypothetical protein [Caudoviricetes sp.]
MKITFLDQTFDITLPCDTELFWVAATNNNRLMVFASKPECKDGFWHGDIIPQDSIQYVNSVADYTKSVAAFKTTIKAEPFAEDNYSELLKYIDEHKPTNETIPEFAFIYMVRQQLWSLEFVEYGDIVIIDSSDYEAIGMIAVDTDASRIFFKLKLFNMGVLINFNKDEVSWVNNIDDDYSDDYLDKAEAYSCKPINLPSTELSIYKMLSEALVKER